MNKFTNFCHFCIAAGLWKKFFPACYSWVAVLRAHVLRLMKLDVPRKTWVLMVPQSCVIPTVSIDKRVGPSLKPVLAPGYEETWGFQVYQDYDLRMQVW